MLNDKIKKELLNLYNVSESELSKIYKKSETTLKEFTKKNPEELGENVEIVINGKKSNVYSETYKTINAKVVHDLFSMPSLLEDVRMSVLS